MKIRLLVFFFFITLAGCSHTKIKISSPNKLDEDYQLINKSAKAFIQVSHAEDMGVGYMHYFRLKSNIPNGTYKIFVDDTLEVKAFIKDSEYDGTWTYFYRNGQLRSKETYKKGKLNGLQLRFFENGNIEFKIDFEDGKPIGVAYNFYESGKIHVKNYFENGKHIKQEVFDKNGEIKNTD